MNNANANLLIYLHDHLAGSKFAIELLDDLSNRSAEPTVQILVTELVQEIRADRACLEQLIDACGGDPKSAKDVVSWIGQKASRFKLNPRTTLGVFEAVEFLSLGVRGKLALWDALQAAADDTSTIDVIVDLNRLRQRATEQHQALESLRLKMAASLFAGWSRDIHFREREKALSQWSVAHGIAFHLRRFAAGKAGQFNGISVSMNSSYIAEERFYYAAHAIGSIVIWSRDPRSVQAMFDELRDAKQSKSADPQRLAQAIEQYRRFETESSEYAVSILREIGAESDIAPYTNFMRADLEAMTRFHETGEAPVWREFFAGWNAQVAKGDQNVPPYEAKAVSSFQAVRIEKQAILQQQHSPLSITASSSERMPAR